MEKDYGFCSKVKNYYRLCIFSTKLRHLYVYYLKDHQNKLCVCVYIYIYIQSNEQDNSPDNCLLAQSVLWYQYLGELINCFCSK